MGTKLLVSIVSLLFLVVVALDVSTILLVTEDKRAYVYQTQSTEAVLAGREFVNRLRHALDTLRLSQASVNPLKPVTPQELSALQSVINNQSEISVVTLQLIQPATAQVVPVARSVRPADVSAYGLTAEDIVISPDLVKIALPELLKNAYAFLNFSKLNHPPMLGIALADLNLKDNPAGIPVAIGWVSLKSFAQDLRGSSLSITDREGWLLFDADPSAFFAKKNISDDPLFVAATASQLSTGAQEYELNEGERWLGSYVRPGLDLIVLTRTQWKKAMSATYALTERYILLGCIVTGLAIIFALLFAKTMTAPLNRLYQATKEVAAGNFEVDLAIKGRDEISALAGSFVSMSRKIRDLIQESIRKVHLENELAIASTVQQNLIPAPAYKNDFIHLRSHYQSAAECGGDWWGHFTVGKKMVLMISDATGHGLPSALITASARSCFSVIQKIAQEDPNFSFSPARMLSYANRVVFDSASGKIMMTFFLGVIDFESMTLTYASAGHNPPWLFKKDEKGFALKSLTAVGQRLGEGWDVDPFEERQVPVAIGDVLFLYTDGLMEGKSTSGEMYGKKRVRKLFETNVSGGPEHVVTQLVTDFLVHNEGKPLDDDLTVAVGEILDPGAAPT